VIIYRTEPVDGSIGATARFSALGESQWVRKNIPWPLWKMVNYFLDGGNG
jgi:hypothetical protein